ncbi:MAG: hypothetical protein Q8R36_05380 [bacterium]|nr:hypothetical protein [bacterium]
MKIFQDKLQIIGMIAAIALAGFISWRYPIFLSTYRAASIIFPFGGETFPVDKPIELRWTSGNPGIRQIDLIPKSYVPIVLYQASVFGYPIYDTSGSYTFTPSARGVLPGEYYVKIYTAGSSEYSETTSPIKIITPQPPATPVVVISPNGGETFTLGSPIKIFWSGGKNKIWVGIAKGEYVPGGTYPLMAFITKDALPNSFLTWDGNLCVLANDCRPVTYWQPSGSIKVVVVSENADGDYCTQSPDRPCNLDASNGAFTIKTVPPSPSPAVVVPKKPAVSSPTPIKPKSQITPPTPSPTRSAPVITAIPPTSEITKQPLPSEESSFLDLKPQERKGFFNRILGGIKGVFSLFFGGD